MSSPGSKPSLPLFPRIMNALRIIWSLSAAGMVCPAKGRGARYIRKRETMTSQPGTLPPGTTGHEGTPGGSRPASTEQWLVRLLPLMLLIILGLAGLRGAVATPRWDGPLHRDGLVIGLALEVVLGALLVITLWRRSAGVDAQRAGATAVSAVAVKLRGVLIFVLTAGMIAVAVALFFGLGLHLFTAKSARPVIRHPATATPKVTVPPPGSAHGAAFHIPLAALLYAVLVVVLLAGVDRKSVV